MLNPTSAIPAILNHNAESCHRANANGGTSTMNQKP
jgi:hypothetical protein